MTTLKESFKTEFTATFTTWLQELQKLRNDMETVSDPAVAERFLASGPLKVGQFQAAVKNFKQSSKMKTFQVE